MGEHGCRGGVGEAVLFEGMVGEGVGVCALAVMLFLRELDVAFAFFAVFGAVAVALAGCVFGFGCGGCGCGVNGRCVAGHGRVFCCGGHCG